MKTATSRARVGFLVFVGVITFVVAIFLVGQKSQLFSSTFKVNVNFSSAEGVKPGAVVVLSGYNVGSVSDIQLSKNADSVRLLLRISSKIRQFVKQDTKAEIKQEGLVGNKIINLLPGSAKSSIVEEYGFIQGVPPFALTGLADNVNAITDTTKIITGELKVLLQRLNRGEGSFGKMFTDEEVYDNLTSITHRTDAGLELATEQLLKLSDLLIRVTESVDVLVRKADTTVSHTNTAAAELTDLLHRLNEGKGTMGALLNDRAMYDTLVTLIGSLTNLTYDASNTADQAARSIYSMRQHWLLGRVFAGEDFEDEAPPVSSWKARMRMLERKSHELEQREARILELEKKIGIDSGEPRKDR